MAEMSIGESLALIYYNTAVRRNEILWENSEEDLKTTYKTESERIRERRKRLQSLDDAERKYLQGVEDEILSFESDKKSGSGTDPNSLVIRYDEQITRMASERAGTVSSEASGRAKASMSAIEYAEKTFSPSTESANWTAAAGRALSAQGINAAADPVAAGVALDNFMAGGGAAKFNALSPTQKKVAANALADATGASYAQIAAVTGVPSADITDLAIDKAKAGVTATYKVEGDPGSGAAGILKAREGELRTERQRLAGAVPADEATPSPGATEAAMFLRSPEGLALLEAAKDGDISDDELNAAFNKAMIEGQGPPEPPRAATADERSILKERFFDAQRLVSQDLEGYRMERSIIDPRVMASKVRSAETKAELTALDKREEANRPPTYKDVQLDVGRSKLAQKANRGRASDFSNMSDETALLANASLQYVRGGRAQSPAAKKYAATIITGRKNGTVKTREDAVKTAIQVAGDDLGLRDEILLGIVEEGSRQKGQRQVVPIGWEGKRLNSDEVDDLLRRRYNESLDDANRPGEGTSDWPFTAPRKKKTSGVPTYTDE